MAKGVNIVDIQNRVSSMDLYFVRKSFDNRESQILVTQSLDVAKKKADANPGYYVFDSKGRNVYVPFKKSTPTKYNLRGFKITVKSLNIYARSDSTIPDRSITGQLEFVDGILKNDKYRVRLESGAIYYMRSIDLKKYIK